ncbi:MAG: 16S rRNA processing protein RimM [Flavobacteriia bacterium]|nr:16S rRNA processing protein RimM [Flavobacteriia bacterium]OJX34849.1 MAG: 16S rRNA processing protein RimM [Flavobacteriia bacterium 40-80]
MNKADCYHLGYVSKLHGFKGEVSLFLDVTDPSEYRKLDMLFIELNGNLTPFIIEKIQLTSKNFALVKFDGINSEDEASFLVKKQLYLPVSTLPKLSGTDFYDHEIIGFKVIDLHFGEVGVMEQVIDLPVNPLFQIIHQSGSEVLIPLRKDFITRIDRENKELHLDVPQGLIEIYLE